MTLRSEKPPEIVLRDWSAPLKPERVAESHEPHQRLKHSSVAKRRFLSSATYYCKCDICEGVELETEEYLDYLWRKYGVDLKNDLPQGDSLDCNDVRWLEAFCIERAQLKATNWGREKKPPSLPHKSRAKPTDSTNSHPN